jgi:peptidoglycan/LPS O-acetylase OafA/YrhL
VRLAVPFTTFRPETAVVQPSDRVRLYELDGLRGWAALSVVLYHIFWETFGPLVPAFRSSLSAIFCDGPFAVAIFFVLSGEALSTAYFAGKGEAAVVKLAVQRYSRLTLPILATCAIILVLIYSGLNFAAGAAPLVHREDWLGGFLTQPASLLAYAKYALFTVYAAYQPAGLGDPFLWTMHYEMLGSFVVFVILLGYRHIRFAPALVLGAAALMLIDGGTIPIGCFLAGLVFSQARQAGVFSAIHKQAGFQALSWAAVLLLLATQNLAHKWGSIDVRLPLAIPLVFAIFCNKALCSFFASGPSRLLGKLSFPIYLMQFPVLISFTSWAIMFASTHGGLTLPVIWAIGLVSLLVCFAGAWLFLPVEAATRRVGAWVSDRLIARPA